MAELHRETLRIPVGGGREICGDLCVPEGARALVLFAHGSGSNRHSPRNQHVAERLQQAGMATLLVDLLAPGEESAHIHTAAWLREDVPFLAERLITVTRWLERHPRLGSLPRGLFGSYTGAAAALLAAALRPEGVHAVVGRGGHPELAGDALVDVLAPTLLIVGELDSPLIPLNRDALGQLGCSKQLEVVAGASHLFHEPGALDRVAELAGEWFQRHLLGVSAAESHPTA
jgi:putative phosphoribosyl transferase